MTANQCNVLGEWGDDLGSVMSQGRWRSVSKTIHDPCNAAVAGNKWLAFRGGQPGPGQPWEMPRLEIPGLHVDHFQLIAAGNDPPPPEAMVGLEVIYT